MSTNSTTEAEYSIDVGALRIAHTYAEALLNAAEKQGKASEVIDELDWLVHSLLQSNPQFALFLDSRAIGRDKKKAVLQKTFGGRSSEIILNFLFVLNAHDRLDLLQAVLIEAREIHEKRTGKVRVEVRTAVPLPADQLEQLTRLLRDSLKKEPVVNIRVDADLLGGIVVRVGDWLHDASVQTRLETLKKQLIERSSYEIQSRRDRFCSANGN
jgi:F-type H+-transporting ATPase subunit delta